MTLPNQTPGLIYWFRQDLRLSDQPALTRAIARVQASSEDRLGPQLGWLLPVFVHDPRQDEETRWGFMRQGPHRRVFRAQALAELRRRLEALDSTLLELSGRPEAVLPELARELGAAGLVCEAIAAPEEEACIQALRTAGLAVECHWHSSLLDPAALPFPPEQAPNLFTAFRQAVERAGVQPAAPLPAPERLPPWPSRPVMDWLAKRPLAAAPPQTPRPCADPRSAFPYALPAWHGGEGSAQAHLRQYCERGLPHHYKATRNRLSGIDESSKLSPWLAIGTLSARQIMTAIRGFEAERGANEGTYWLWFELLWRDHFRFMHLKHGRRLYQAAGLSSLPPPTHDPAAFERWCQGRTGEALIDAGMHELAATGYLSNRMRQIVASALIHDLACDWRAGAAWFESQLVDDDVYSNQGNWLYIAGRGTDPRGGRRFDPLKQAREHDPDGVYRARWAAP
ncbi:MAG: DASH family cryptochrome [Sphingobacteriia bacterium]|nr:DASH family cryptochrome [Sphingobacteriia bacterium]NCC40165.1 DASH family cryptochrome [Gammaproteobacteria bacterium]